MVSPAFVALLAALLVILHITVAAYIYRVTLSTDDRRADGPAATDEPPAARADRHSDIDERTPCPTCGAPNDPSYQYCRRCVADLTGSQVTTDGAAAGRLGS